MVDFTAGNQIELFCQIIFVNGLPIIIFLIDFSFGYFLCYRKVRTELWRKFSGDRRFYLQRHRFAGYQSEIVRSVFCLCPLGWAPWSPRLVESIALGCVPVIIADGIRLPFPDAVPWPEISLTVAERDVAKLGMILEHVAATNLSAIQKNLWDPVVKRALLFNNQIEEGDATWHVLYALAQKLDRSHRTVRVWD